MQHHVVAAASGSDLMEHLNETVLRDFSLTDGEKEEFLISVRKQLVKLLTLIEAERDGGASARFFFAGFLFDIGSADWLFENRLSSVLVKLNGLYHDNAYLTLDHRVVRNKVFESRGIVDGLIRELRGTARSSGQKPKRE